MDMATNNKNRPMEVLLTREQAINTITNNLVKAGILLRGEAQRYRKVLESYDNLTLVKVLLYSHQFTEAGGEIIT